MPKVLQMLSALVFAAGALNAASNDSPAARLATPTYHYVSLSAALPPAFTFIDQPVKVTSARRVYATAYSCDVSCVPSVVAYHQGRFKVIGNGIAYSANEQGVVGGSVLVDPDIPIEQAALFDGSRIELIPRRIGESTSHVVKVTDSGIVLVASDGEPSGFYLYDKHRRVYRLDVGGGQVLAIDVNDKGEVAGTTTVAALGHYRAFRLASPFAKPELLAPTPPETDSWGMRINDRGDVLGYSFVATSGFERISVWRGNVFETLLVEGTPARPTTSKGLLWNRKGLIVITATTFPDLDSYLVPRPNVRLKLADLADRLPAWTLIADINERGDLVGSGGSTYFNAEESFLLERIPPD